jgi:hypothetical protein
MYIRSGEAHLVTIVREDKVGRYIDSGSSPADLENSREGVDTVQSRQLVNVHNGPADLEMILREEREEKHIRRLQEETEERGEILVMGQTLYLMSFSHC